MQQWQQQWGWTGSLTRSRHQGAAVAEATADFRDI
jgi:hypothetical protein